jgi:hypothetical protein
MCHWLSPDTPVRVSSFGGLQHFRKSGKPLEAGDATRCLDCAYERQCPYSAKKGESPLPALISHMCVEKEGTFQTNFFVQFIWTGLPRVTLAGRLHPSWMGFQISRTLQKRSHMGLTGNACMRAIMMSVTTRYDPDSRFSDTRPTNHTHPLPRRSSTSNTHQAQLSPSPWSPIPPWSVNDRPVCILLMARSSAT